MLLLCVLLILCLAGFLRATATITKSVVIDGNGATVIRNGTAFTTALKTAGSGVAVAVVAAANTGTLTTRTDNDTGVATLSTGHGLITGDLVDVYWSGGRRRAMLVTVATNAITIDGGAGTNLPVVTTAMSVVKPTVITVATVTMANVKAWLAKIVGTSAEVQVTIGVTSAGTFTEGAYLLLNNTTTSGHVWGDTALWDDLFSEANPILAATTFTTINVSSYDATYASTFSFDVAT